MSDIEDVIIRFAWNSDEADWDSAAGLLTDDVTLEIPVQGIALGPGRDEVLAHAEKTVSARAARGERGRHVVTNILVDMAPDGTAAARSYVTFMVTTADGTTRMFGFARYEDRLVQVDGTWRLAARAVTLDGDLLGAAPR
jgi:hypothetical protein